MDGSDLLRVLRRTVHRALRSPLAAVHPALSPADHVVALFRAARATSPACAQRFHPDSPATEAAFLQLLRDGVIRQPAPAHYFLDERELQRWEAGS